MKQLFALVFLALASCVVVGAARLDSTWSGEAHPGVLSTLAFHLDGKARWVFDLPDGPQVYLLDYDLQPNPERVAGAVVDPPSRLDFSGFESGPFAGKTLYGIVEWTDYTLLYDARPGDPGPGGDAVRPTDFTNQARRFQRVK